MRTYTCIICPNGCEISADGQGEALVIDGAVCARGREYVTQEMTDPRRTISSLVNVEGGDRPLVGVRITSAIPRDRIGEAMTAIKAMRCRAPVRRGEKLASGFLGLGCDLVAIDEVPRVS